jgi:hypothetical protein
VSALSTDGRTSYPISINKNFTVDKSGAASGTGCNFSGVFDGLGYFNGGVLSGTMAVNSTTLGAMASNIASLLSDVATIKNNLGITGSGSGSDPGHPGIITKPGFSEVQIK